MRFLQRWLPRAWISFEENNAWFNKFKSKRLITFQSHLKTTAKNKARHPEAIIKTFTMKRRLKRHLHEPFYQPLFKHLHSPSQNPHNYHFFKCTLMYERFKSALDVFQGRLISSQGAVGPQSRPFEPASDCHWWTWWKFPHRWGLVWNFLNDDFTSCLIAGVSVQYWRNRILDTDGWEYATDALWPRRHRSQPWCYLHCKW